MYFACIREMYFFRERTIFFRQWPPEEVGGGVHAQEAAEGDQEDWVATVNKFLTICIEKSGYCEGKQT